MSKEQYVEALRKQFEEHVSPYPVHFNDDNLLGYMCSVEAVTRKPCDHMDRLDWVDLGQSMEEVNSEILKTHTFMNRKYKISLDRSTSTSFNFEVKNRILFK